MKLVRCLLIILMAVSCNAKEQMLNKFKNHLQNETSPYLLQHASNPVDWYPWGQQAFTKAEKEDKPIFLSIGYSSCHWCHVMEHESFEDSVVAAVLNENFVSIKVDREERPDIDNIYMMACQLMGGNCGWPLNAILNQKKQPFLVKTYLPKKSIYGRQGLIETLELVSDLWKNNREKIEKYSSKMSEAISSDVSGASHYRLDEDVLQQAYISFENSYDSDYGGFNINPKFPSPHQLTFLLRFYKYSKNKQALDMVSKTLLEMRKGGIFDQVGGGFHRYSTDQYWLLPHFEKMLYDQATLLKAYTECYQITKNEIFKETALRIADYVLDEMASENGGFYSAEDADSEGIEGKYYVWEIEEIKDILGDDADKFIQIYNLKPEGNYSEEARGHGAGGNIAHVKISFEKIADILKIKESEVLGKLKEFSDKIFAFRDKRIHPFKDKKILTDWNSMMNGSLAYASRVFKDKRLAKSALKNDLFIENNMNKNGLLHSYLNGKSNIDAMLDDYAYLINSKLELYRTTFEASYLEQAIKLTEITIEKFWDQQGGGFYFSDGSDSNLITKTKEIYDGAIPSGNSVMFQNLLRLYKITGNLKYNEFADKQNKAFAGIITKHPSSFSEFISGLFMIYYESYEIVISSGSKHNELIEEINNHFLPNSVVLFNDSDKMLNIAKYLSNMNMIDGKPTAFVCKNYACELPTTNKEKMLENLKLNK